MDFSEGMNSDPLQGAPRSYHGRWFNWLWKPGDRAEGTYRVQSVFISRELHDVYGKRAVHYDNETVPASRDFAANFEEVEDIVELDLETLREQRFEVFPPETRGELQELGVHEENWDTVLLTSDLRDFVFGESQSVLIYSSRPGSAAPAPIPTYGAFEEHYRATEPELGRRQIPEYSGPIFAYAIDNNVSGSEPHKLVEPTAPINVAWSSGIGLPPQNNASPTNVSYHMMTNDEPTKWKKKLELPQGLRHVIVREGSEYYLQAQTDDVGKSIRGTKQWHCRLFRVPQAMDSWYRVAGQAHQDPLDHNWLSKMTSIIPKRPWKCSDSRQQVSGHWDNSGYQIDQRQINNNTLPDGTDVQSSGGQLDLAKNAPSYLLVSG